MANREKQKSCIGQRIKELRADIKQKDLASAIGVSVASLSAYEKNTNEPPLSVIIQLSEFFGVTTDYLLGNSPVRHGSMEIQSVNDDRYIPIPVIGVVAAGYQALADTNIIGYELVSSDILNDGFEYAWLKVKGDSMYPLIMDGDLVLVRLQDEIDSGDLAVVIVDEEDGVIKRVQYSTNKVTLVSENAEKFPPRVFEKADISRLRIWGKAIDLKRKLR